MLIAQTELGVTLQWGGVIRARGQQMGVRVSPSPCAWLSAGLDAAVQGYPFEEWGLASTELLRLSEGALEALGVWRVGHQELLLEAVEQLRALVSNAAMGGGVWDG